MGRRHMVGIAGHSIADKLGVDLGAPRLGPLVFFEHDDAGAFAHHESVAILVVGSTGAFRLIVEVRRQGARLSKAGDPERAEGILGTAGKHDVRIIHGNHSSRVTDRMSTSRASGNDRVIRSHQAVADRNLARDEVYEPPMDEVRAYPPGSLFM